MTADRFDDITQKQLREERALIERRQRQVEQREAERLRAQHRAVEPPEAQL
jgi:hypothetical protein